jgi:hypothetical protein
MPPEHRFYAEWSQDRFIRWAGKTGEATARLVEKILATRPYPEQGYKACLGIINLTRDYEPVRVEAAARRALKFKTCSYRSMKAILSSGLDRQSDNGEQPRLPGLPPHQNIRGPEYYRERSKPMLNQQMISIMHSLKLHGMAESFEKRLADSNQASLSHDEFVGLLVQDEKLYRDNLRLRRLLKNARLRQEASLEDIDYGAPRGLSRQVMPDTLGAQPFVYRCLDDLTVGLTGAL